jgi:hypothetical protein
VSGFLIGYNDSLQVHSLFIIGPFDKVKFLKLNWISRSHFTFAVVNISILSEEELLKMINSSAVKSEFLLFTNLGFFHGIVSY